MAMSAAAGPGARELTGTQHKPVIDSVFFPLTGNFQRTTGDFSRHEP